MGRLPHTRRRWLRIGALSAGALALIAVAWLGWRVWTVKAELDELLPLAGDAQTAIEAGDQAALSAAADAMAASAGRASAATADPIWQLAEAFPGVGVNFTAVRVVATQLERIAGAAPAVLTISSGFADRAPGAVVDPELLAASSTAISKSAHSIAGSAEVLDAVEMSGLIEPVARGVVQVREAVDILEPLADAAAGAARILPAVLGGAGDRSILVMVLNPAELRTGGGISGSFVELRAQDGRLTLVRQADSSQFAPLTTPIAAVPSATTALYGDGVGRYVQNAAMTPDFADTGRIASNWWSGLTGHAPDMVVAVDPFALQAVLSVTGPVELSTGAVLDAGNVLDSLLVNSYRSLTSDEQTSLFSSAAEAVFARVSSGATDPLALLRALEEPARDGRLSAWSAHPDEQRLLERTVLGGPRARQDAAGAGAFAVYFNDATGGKMATYLDVSIDARTVACRADDIAEVAVSLTMGSHAPADVASLPGSVTGGGHFGVGIGDIGTNVTVTAPQGSYVGAVIVKGEPYPAATAIDDGRAASTARVNLSPGEVNVLEFRFLLPRGQADALTIVHTPLMNPADLEIAAGCPAPVSP